MTQTLGLDVDTVRTIPPAPGLSFRGRGSGQWVVGRTYVHDDWLHTSRDPRVATDNFAAGDVVALFGGCGRDLLGLTDHPEEQETIYLPGARFTVLRQGFVGSIWLQMLVVLRDDDRPERIVDVGDRARRAVAALVNAQRVPRVQVGREGRFCGPFGTPLPDEG